jgi:hypothetical protein
MTKYLQNLERLHRRMALRYGGGDDLVLQLQQEISALEKKAAKDLDATNIGCGTVDKAPPTPLRH